MLGWDFAPSPTWGRLGWGVSRKGIFLVIILNSGAKRNVIQNPLHRDGILLLPRLGEGWDGECPARVLSFRHSEQRSKAERDSESPAPGWDFAPSPTWGRLGWGVTRKGTFFSSF